MELRKLTEDDLKKNIGLLSYAYKANKDLFPLFFEYQYDGEIKYLYCYDNWFSILCKKSDKQLNYYGFALDDEYELLYSGYDNFFVEHNQNGMDVIVSDVHNMSFVLIYGRTEVPDGVLDGYVAFTQTQPDNSTLSFVHPTYYAEGRKIFKYFLKKPYLYYFFNKKGKAIKYLNKDIEFHSQPTFFNTLSVREYGVSEVLKKGAVRLQKTDKINRYFKLPFQSDKMNHIFKYFASFYKIYTEEQFYKIIEDSGFLTEIPDYVLDFYNGDYKQLEEYKALAIAIKEYYKSNNMLLVLNLDREVI